MIWLGAEGPTDQRVDDAGSLCFDSAPLAAPLEILGAPVLELELASDRPVAFVCARLNDVAPDGSSLRVTYGLLNLTQRESREHPQPLEPGRRYRVHLRLDDIGHHFRAGHRIRVALSTAYWPMIWPSPEPVTLTVTAGASALELPVRPIREEPPVVFPPPESAPDLVTEKLRPASNSRRIVRDVGSGEVRVEIHDDFGDQRIPGHGLESGMWARETWRVKPDDPLAAAGETHWEATMARGAWRIRTVTRARLTADRTDFHVEGELVAYEGNADSERLIVKRSFKQTLRRVLM